MRTWGALGFTGFASAWPIDHWYTPCFSDLYRNAAFPSYCAGYLFDENVYCECMMNNDDYLRSQFTCIEQFRNYTNAALDKQYGHGTTEESWDYMSAVWKHKKPKYTAEQMRALITAIPVTQTWTEANTTGSGAFLHSSALLNEPIVKRQLDNIWQMTWVTRLGGITVAYVCAILAVQALFNLLSWVVPSGARVLANNSVARYLRKYIAIPALFHKNRAQPVKIFRHIQLCYPNRMHSLLILGYIAVCTACLAYHYPVHLSPSSHVTDSTHKAGWLGWRSGCLALYKLPFIWLFAGRNNVLIWITGWQFEIFNIWHRWIARMFLVDVLVHSAAYTYKLHVRGILHIEWGESWFKWGVVGTIIIALLCVHSTKTLRAPAYEFFKYLHIAMAALALCATWYHSSMFFYIEQNYITWAIWGLDRALRLGRIGINGLNNNALIKAHPNGFLEVIVKYNGRIQPSGGTYYYIHFGDPLYFYQSHPLSVIPTDTRGNLRFVAKMQRGMTKRLYDKALSSGLEVTQRIWLDGPYGAPFSIEGFKEVSLYAGGVGFTAVYGHLAYFLRENDDKTYHLHWCISTIQVLELFEEEVMKLHNHPSVNVTIHLDDREGINLAPPSNSQRNKSGRSSIASQSPLHPLNIELVYFCPDFEGMVNEEIASSTGPIAFFCCGPPPMSDAVRFCCAQNLLKSKSYVQYYEESFTM